MRVTRSSSSMSKKEVKADAPVAKPRAMKGARKAFGKIDSPNRRKSIADKNIRIPLAKKAKRSGDYNEVSDGSSCHKPLNRKTSSTKKKVGIKLYPDCLPEVETAFDKFDAKNVHKPLEFAEYADEIYVNHKTREDKYSPSLYMHVQSDLNVRMRSILIDWVVEVHLKFKLCPVTLFLTVNLIDRYLSVREVDRTDLQLVGVACLLIASKYEEIYPPEIRDCVYITDSAYTSQQVVKMEGDILNALHFEITVPTVHSFLQRYFKVGKLSELQIQRASYFTERCLQEHDMLAYRPSIIASAAVWMARLQDEQPNQAWSPELRSYTGYDIEQLTPCAKMMLDHLDTEPVTTSSRHLVAVKKKYMAVKNLAVATEGLPTITQETLHENFV